MGFKEPSAGGGFRIDEGWYVATMEDLVQEKSTKGFDGNPPADRMKWVMSLKNEETGEIVTNDHGLPLEWFEWTSLSLGKKSNARPMAEAFIGHSIDDMTADQVEQALFKKSCRVKIMDAFKEGFDDPISRTVQGSWKAIPQRTPARTGAA